MNGNGGRGRGNFDTRSDRMDKKEDRLTSMNGEWESKESMGNRRGINEWGMGE